MRHAREYKGCSIFPEKYTNGLCIGTYANRHSFWKIFFPDDSWVLCRTLNDCAEYIDGVLANEIERAMRYPNGLALDLLKEASRRYLMYYLHTASIRAAWTGLGTATDYKPAENKGLMEIATSPNPGRATWWRLTDKGASIVRWWIEDGRLGLDDYDLRKGLDLYELPGKMRYLL